MPGERLTLPTETHTTSGIDNMVRVLEDTRSHILEEHRAVRQKLHALVGELVRGGFERAVLDGHRDELTSLRTRMAALRRRLQQIQRRLKTVVGRTRHADADLGKQLSNQLDHLRKLDPGLQRALLALQMMEIAFVEPWGGTTISMGDDDVEARGSALARAVPGAAVAGGIARLLGTGVPRTDTSTEGGAPSTEVQSTHTGSTNDGVGDKDVVRSLRTLSDVLKGSL